MTATERGSPLHRAAAMALLLISCRGEAETGESGRSYQPLPDSYSEIGGSLTDTLVLVPRVFATDGTHVFYFDHGDYRVKAVDLQTRELQWAWGRQGEGPEELRNPWQLVLDPTADGVWIVDAGNSRASLVRNGQLLREMPLQTPDGMIARLVPLGDVQLATTFDSEAVLAADLHDLSENGIAFPDQALAALDPVLRQSLVGTNGDLWAAAFVFSGGFLLYRGRDLVCMGRARIGIPFEEVASAPVPSSGRRTTYLGGVALSDSLVFIAGRSDDGEDLSVLDMYSTDDCAYLGSVDLTHPIRGIAASSRTVIVSFDEPLPRLVVYRAAAFLR